MAEIKSKNVCFTLDPEAYALAVAKAAERGVTVAALAKSLISGLTTSSENQEIGEVETQHYERVKISLSRDEKEAIASHAKENSWSMSRECRFRIISSLLATPKLRQDELAAIRGLRSAVDAVGRTVSYMLRSGRLVVNDPELMAELAKVELLRPLIVERILSLETATVDRWSHDLKKMKST